MRTPEEADAVITEGAQTVRKLYDKIAEQRRRAESAEAKLARVEMLLRRYRNETPLGNQPHMIAGEVDELLRSIEGSS